MNLLRQIKFPQQKFAKCISLMETRGNVEQIRKKNVDCLILEELRRRDVVRVKGDEATAFLQGLITNDMTHLQYSDSGSMYAMFLNTSGRILFDTILYRTKEPDCYLIECDQNVSLDLRRHMRTYKVRRNLQIEAVNNEYKMWIIFDPKSLYGKPSYTVPPTTSDVHIYHDPRIRDFGMRLVSKSDHTWDDLSKMFSVYNSHTIANSNEENNYQIHRYRYGVAEGAVEIPPGKLFPLEANLDFLNGVSFHKGCYIGQELTARVHHMGAVRKRHMPLKITEPLTKVNEIVQNQAGANIGTVLGALSDRAVALLRMEQALSANTLTIDGNPCFVEKPKWWPKELPKRVSMSE